MHKLRFRWSSGKCEELLKLLLSSLGHVSNRNIHGINETFHYLLIHPSSSFSYLVRCCNGRKIMGTLLHVHVPSASWNSYRVRLHNCFDNRIDHISSQFHYSAKTYLVFNNAESWLCKRPHSRAHILKGVI